MGLARDVAPPAWLDRDARVYRVKMPPDITIVAACEDVGCDQYRKGWETTCDELGDPMAVQVAMLIRSGATGRDFTEGRGTLDDGRVVTVFRFPAGQRCFQEHKTRPGRLLVHQRGHLIREHARLADLAEDYTEHAGLITDLRQKG
jgi:hypothetical protein